MTEYVEKSDIKILDNDDLSIDLSVKKKAFSLTFTLIDNDVFLNITVFKFINIHLDITNVFDILLNKIKKNIK